METESFCGPCDLGDGQVGLTWSGGLTGTGGGLACQVMLPAGDPWASDSPPSLLELEPLAFIHLVAWV